MKFKKYILPIIFSFCSVVSFAGNGGGTGPLPTEGSMISLDMDGQIIIGPNNLGNLIIGNSVGLNLENKVKPDLSQGVVFKGVKNVKFANFNKIQIVDGKSKSGDTISKVEVLDVLNYFKQGAPNPKVEAVFESYSVGVKSGKINLILLTDEEDKVVLTNSSDTKR